jgi:hypothetical protein
LLSEAESEPGVEALRQNLVLSEAQNLLLSEAESEPGVEALRQNLMLSEALNQHQQPEASSTSSLKQNMVNV